MILVHKGKRDGKDCLIGSREKDRNALRAIDVGEEFWIKPWIMRSPGAHKKFFGMLAGVFHNLPENLDCHSPHELRSMLLVEAGFVERIRNFQGEEIEVPKSMAWHQMDESEFKKVFNEVVKILRGPFFWPDLTPGEIRDLVNFGVENDYEPV